MSALIHHNPGKYGRNVILRQRNALSRGLQQGSVLPASEYENTFAQHCDKKTWELIVELDGWRIRNEFSYRVSPVRGCAAGRMWERLALETLTIIKSCRCITRFSQRRFKVSFFRVRFKEATRGITGNNWINEGWMIMKAHVWSDMRLKKEIYTAVMGFKIRNPAWKSEAWFWDWTGFGFDYDFSKEL